MSMDPAELETSVLVIVDEFSSMSDDEYAVALAAWMAEADTAEPIDISISTADTLREIREHGES